MASVARPRRNLGPSEHWGRVVEFELDKARGKRAVGAGAVAGQGRAQTAGLDEIAKRADRLRGVLELVPHAIAESTTTAGFGLSDTSWTTVASLDVLPQPDSGKTHASLSIITHCVMRGAGTVRPGEPGGAQFQWPFPLSTMTDYWRYRDDVGRWHYGMDFGVSSGTPIYAPADGWVTHVGYTGTAGNNITLEHAGPSMLGAPSVLSTDYYHLVSPAPLSVGAAVVRGVTIVGYVGNTGASFGAHLHWQTSINGELVDPYVFMGLFGGAGEPGPPIVTSARNLYHRVIVQGSTGPELATFSKGSGEPAMSIQFGMNTWGFDGDAPSGASILLQARSEGGAENYAAHADNFATITVLGAYS